MNTGTIVGEFEKNSREVVRVSLTEYNGVDLLDVRAFYQAGGDWKPGKGIAVRRELITPLRKALQAAEKAMKDGPQAADTDA
jgi:hypothetical protein